MSWLFGSSKKKEPPPVTVDPSPIESEFYFVPKIEQAPVNPHPLYPDLNGTHNYPLPYSLSPHVQSSSPSTSSDTISSSRSTAIEVSNQLESIPFRIAPSIQADVNARSDPLGPSLNEFRTRLMRVRQFFDSDEFNYNFDLERRIIREAKMVNESVAY